MLKQFYKTKFLPILLIFGLIIFSGCSQTETTTNPELDDDSDYYQTTETHPLVEAGRAQIGVVTQYDTGYYQGGYPPADRGACSDAIIQALLANNYNLKEKIDADMANHPERYPNEFDSNINFRRVQNIKVFLDYNAESLPTCTDNECFENGNWQAGDIITFDQIPGGLWHIAIVSNKNRPASDDDSVRIPLLIHNHGRGVVEDDLLLDWPAPISGHYRFTNVF